MNFHSKNILILMIVCNLAALSGYYLLFQHVKTQTEQASSLIGIIDSGEQKDSLLNSLRSVVKDTEMERQQLGTLLLTSDSEVSFIEQLETLAKNSGLDAKTNNVSDVVGDPGTPKDFLIEIGTTGSWNDTMYFLSQMEDLPYNIHLRSVSMTKPSAADKTVTTVTNKSTGSSWNATFDVSVTEST